MPVIKPGGELACMPSRCRFNSAFTRSSSTGHVFALDWSGLQTPEISFYALCGYEKSPFNQFLHLDLEAQPTDKRRPLTEEQIRAAHVGEVKPLDGRVHTDINLHTFSADCPEVDRMLMFRDWLRLSPAALGNGLS